MTLIDMTDTRSTTVEGYVFQIIDGPEAGGYLHFFETYGHVGRRVHCNSTPLADATLFPKDSLDTAHARAHDFMTIPRRCVRSTTAVTSLHPSEAQLPAPSGID